MQDIFPYNIASYNCKIYFLKILKLFSLRKKPCAITGINSYLKNIKKKHCNSPLNFIKFPWNIANIRSLHHIRSLHLIAVDQLSQNVTLYVLLKLNLKCLFFNLFNRILKGFKIFENFIYHTRGVGCN